MADRRLRAILELQTQGFQRGARDAGAAAESLADQISRTEDVVQNIQDRLDKLGQTDATVEVQAEIDQATRDLEIARDELQRLDGERAKVEVEADSETASKNLDEIEQTAQDLDGTDAEVNVDADTASAERRLDDVQDEAQALDGTTATVKVDGDTSGLEASMDEAEGAAADTGEEIGRTLGGSLMDALRSIPIAGVFAGLAAAGAGAFMLAIRNGLNNELARDMFSARTGLDEATSRRFGRAAGEAYADAWGESIEANLDTARQALQAGIIDEEATTAEIEHVISSLSGISDIFEYDMPTLITGVGNLMKNGLVRDADEAFDLITAASQRVPTEDLVETVEEYSSQWTLAGLSGEDAMGLIVQAMENGARNTDLVADAVKEMGLRIREGTDPAREALQNLGLDVDDIIAGFQAGGDEGRDAMGRVFDALREVRDEGGNVQEIVANLFGGPGEDLGAALFALDMDAVAEALGGVDGAAGAAETALQTMSDNAAMDVERAKRNIELAVDGISAALASAFSDEISGAAEWVERNRGPMMEFLADITNGFFNLGINILEMLGSARRGFRDFQIEVMEILAPILNYMAFIPGMEGLGDVSTDMRLRIAQLTQEALEEEAGNPLFQGWEQPLIDGLERAQQEFNDFVGPEILAGHIHDAVLESTERLDELALAVETLPEGTLTINGETMNAEEAWQTLVDNINESDGSVTINGETVPVEEALDTMLTLINDGEGVLDINGDRTLAEQELLNVQDQIENAYAAMGIGAEDRGAISQRDTILNRIRTSSASMGITAQVNWAAVYNAINAIQAAAGRAGAAVAIGGLATWGRHNGGWVNPGLNDGGWVPGSNPGYDNVLWPVLPGRAGGGMLAQPLTGGEFVVNADSAARWSGALEFINSGGSPAPIVQRVPVPTHLTVVDADGALVGSMRVAAHGEDRAFDRIKGAWA